MLLYHQFGEITMISVLKHVFLWPGALFFVVGILVAFQQELWSKQFFTFLSVTAFGISGILAYLLIGSKQRVERLENAVNELRRQVFVATDHG